MTRSELIPAISQRYPQLSGEDVEAAAKTIVDAMTQAICRGSRIEIRGFGSFHLNHRAPRTGRNPRTGEKVDIAASRVPHFKVGKNLMERVDQRRARPTHADSNLE